MYYKALDCPHHEVCSCFTLEDSARSRTLIRNREASQGHSPIILSYRLILVKFSFFPIPLFQHVCLHEASFTHHVSKHFRLHQWHILLHLQSPAPHSTVDVEAPSIPLPMLVNAYFPLLLGRGVSYKVSMPWMWTRFKNRSRFLLHIFNIYPAFTTDASSSLVDVW